MLAMVVQGPGPRMAAVAVPPMTMAMRTSGRLQRGSSQRLSRCHRRCRVFRSPTRKLSTRGRPRARGSRTCRRVPPRCLPDFYYRLRHRHRCHPVRSTFPLRWSHEARGRLRFCFDACGRSLLLSLLLSSQSLSLLQLLRRSNRGIDMQTHNNSVITQQQEGKAARVGAVLCHGRRRRAVKAKLLLLR